MIELERIGWENYPSIKTPRNAENLSKMEENTQKAITELENTVNISIEEKEVVTNESINGKKVYCKRIDIGTLPNNSVSEINTGLNVANINLIRMEGAMKNITTNEQYPLPFIFGNSADCVSVWLREDKVHIVTGTDRSAYTGFVNIYYMKVE